MVDPIDNFRPVNYVAFNRLHNIRANKHIYAALTEKKKEYSWIVVLCYVDDDDEDGCIIIPVCRKANKQMENIMNIR
jgi:hypothetical protein